MQTFLFDDEVEALTEFEAGRPLTDDRLRALERFATTDFGKQMLAESASPPADATPRLPSSTPQLQFEEQPAAPQPQPEQAPAEQPRRAPTRNPNSRRRPADMPQDQFQLSVYGPRGMRGSAWLEPFDGLPIDATPQEMKQSLLDRYNDINAVLTEDELATLDDLMRDDTEAASRFFEGAQRIVPGLWDMYMGGLKEGYSGALRRYGMGFFGDPRDQIKQDLATAGETGRKVVIQTRQLWNFFSQMFGDIMAANRGAEIVRQELAAAGQLTGNNRADMPIIQQEIRRRREAGDPVFGVDQDKANFQERYQNYEFNRKLDRAFAGLTSYERDGVEVMEAPDVLGGTTFTVGGQQPMPNMSTGGAMVFDPVNIAAGYAGAFTKARLIHRFAATSGPVFATAERTAASTISYATRKGEQLANFAQRKTGLTANQLTALATASGAVGAGLSQVAGVDPETGMPTSSAAASFGRALFLVSAPLPAIRAAGVMLKATKETAGAAAAVTAEAKAGALGIRSALSPTDQASAIRAARPASAQELLATGAVPKQYARFMRPGGAQQAADSTLKRVAQNTQNPEALRRAARFADQIGVTTAVRVGDDLFSGAVVGGLTAAPFAVAAPDPETAGAIVGGGVAFGTAGNLVGGKFARMQEFIDADIARMMVDVNAMGGDAAAMFGMPKDQLIRLAGTQGILANKGADMIPLRTEDYVANVPEASDGIYVLPNPQTGQRRQVFVDLGHSSLRDGTVRISDNGDGWFNVRVEGDGGYVYAFKTSDPTQLTVKDGDKVKAYQPLNKKSPASMVAGEEFIHAVMDSDMFDGEHKLELRGLIDQEYGRDGVQARKRDYAARIVDDRIAAGTEDNVGFVYSSEAEAKQVAEGTKTIAQIRRERGKTTKQRDEMIDKTIAELDQDSIDRTGDPDAWIKDEILGQTWASLSQSLDLNRLRRGQNPELFTARAAEGVMITSSRALEFFGLKTDPGTGRPLSPPSAVFRENPLTISPVLKKRLIEYVRNYDRYLAGLEDVGSAQPRGVPLARSNSAKDLANSPFVKLRRNPRTGLMENDFMFIDSNGTPVFKEQSDINDTERLRRQQVATLGGDKILPNNSTEFGPRRLDNGRVEISGPTLPEKFFLFNHFPEHVRDFARQFQTGRDDGMSFLVDANVIGTRSSGTYRVRNLGNVRAVQREFVPTGFIRSSTDHLLVAGIDMNAVRAAAMKAINKGELDLFNNDMTTLTNDLLTYLDNHKNGRPGEATIGIAKRDMLNGLIGTGTAVQRKANPLYSDLNRSGSVRTFRLDRVNDIKPTGRTGLHFDYDKLKNNRMPRTDAATLVDDGAAMPDVADAPPFYLKSSQAIDAKVQGKVATPDQIKAILTNPQNGIKAEELKWTGVMQEVERLAKENNGKVPKEALLRYLAEDGAVRLEEVKSSYKAEDQKISAEIDDILLVQMQRAPYSERSAYLKRAKELQDKLDEIKGKGFRERYAQYQLPGGENYREVVLAMPNAALERAASNLRQFESQFGSRPIPAEMKPQHEALRQAVADAKRETAVYTSSHFDTPNYVAHMRLNDRVDAKGKPGLFIEELQSDRHQQGREKGYRSDKEAIPSFEEWLQTDANPSEAANPNLRSRLRQMYDEAIERTQREFELSQSEFIPDAPFRTSWPLQLFKRALRDAVADGKDWIGWTTGETQAARYDLSKQVASISHNKVGEKYGIFAKGHNGETIIAKSYTAQELPDVIGKELAQKVIDGEGVSRQTELSNGDVIAMKQLSGVDLKVGGEGMKGFYDTMVPKEVAKYVKQWGGQVEKGNISQRVTATQDDIDLVRSVGMRVPKKVPATVETPIWRVNITPQMREGIKKAGQALFVGGAAAVVAEDQLEQ